jgi:hypothetical protein
LLTFSLLELCQCNRETIQIIWHFF